MPQFTYSHLKTYIIVSTRKAERSRTVICRISIKYAYNCSCYVIFLKIITYILIVNKVFSIAAILTSHLHVLKQFMQLLSGYPNVIRPTSDRDVNRVDNSADTSRVYMSSSRVCKRQIQSDYLWFWLSRPHEICSLVLSVTGGRRRCLPVAARAINHIMSDTDSIKTDKSQSELQQKYDKLAMEFAKARMQLNVLKKAYTAKTSKLDHRSIESLDQFESSKYDSMSTSSLEIQENFNKTNQVNSKGKGIDELKSKDVQFLRQDINSMHQYIQRVLNSTNSSQLDYNLIMSEIEYCKSLQNSSPNNLCEVLNDELTALKCSVTDCLYNMLYNKLESRTKINTEDSSNTYLHHYCLDNDYKSDEDRLQKVFVTLVLHFFLSFIIHLNDVLQDLLKDINLKDASLALQKSLKSLTNKLHSNSLVLEKILTYSEDLKTFKFDTQHIVMENIVLFISNKYVECVNSIKHFIKSDNTIHIDCSSLRQSMISFMALKFPIGENENVTLKCLVRFLNLNFL
ncbi:hypothetical protein AGLY_014248 [Aphis glycines]|uniref:Uncharacterized protein n=1 Tax=Aphis glycines TaxID=307491 RepID=A0A6G0T602_APHGL|nr:hypothetical protein AGLY_014248 [Aphis glycines]